jgi:N-acetylglucosamine-6-phosphate deacetylase
MLQAFTAARVFDGERFHEGAAVLVRERRVVGLAARAALPADCTLVDYGAGVLAPGFVDLQVNGGGGALFNDAPTPEAIAVIVAAHRRYGTAGLLPTLITDTPATTRVAIASAAAARLAVDGALGLHLEGPHLAPARKGAHPAALMRAMTDADVEQLIEARRAVGALMVTVAAEQAPPALIRRLADAGIVVSLGHSDASYDLARAAFDAGARAVTHLFNAMSQLGAREPGLVGAALATGHVWCGLIADAIHVHPQTARLALAARRGPGKLFLVTDAMSSVGVAGDSFTLHGRIVRREQGRLTLPDGTLAGADVDMATCVRNAVTLLGLPFDEALRMATLYPATLMGLTDYGRIAPGAAAAFVHLDDCMNARPVCAGRAP